MSSATSSGENARLNQIFDETDHKRCTEGNKTALLNETLSQLRGLTKELQEDDWMYTTTTNKNNNIDIHSMKKR